MKRKNIKMDMDKERKTRKVRFDTIQEFARSYDYEILSKNYNNPRTKMQFKCPEKHTFRMAYCDFKQGKRCPVCAIENKKDLKKFTIEKIKELFSKEGYVLKSKEYVSSQAPLDSECSEGHYNKLSLYQFKKGIRCKECSKTAKSQSIDIEYVKKYISGQNYTAVTKKIVNLESKIIMKCEQGHKVSMSFNSFKSGARCSECAEELDTPESIRARAILRDITGFDFTREMVEDNKATNMGHIKYDGYCKQLRLVFDIAEKRDMNKLVFCRINQVKYLRISKEEINEESIREKLTELDIII